MKFMGIGLQSAMMIAGGFALGLLILYVLKLRRRRITVPFTPLWSRVLIDKDASSWFQRLKRLLSLLLWVLVTLLIVLAMADPQPEQELERGTNTVLVIDTSASMATREPLEGNRTRLAVAVGKATEFVDAMSPHDKVMLLAVDGQVRSLTGDFTDDVAVLHEALESLQPSATEARMLEALRTAVDSLTDRKRPQILLFSDGAHSELARIVDAGEGAAPSTTEGEVNARVGAEPTIEYVLPDKLIRDEIQFDHEVVGSESGNIAISGFNIRRYLSNKLDYEVYVQVRNFFNRPVFAELTLYNLIPDESTATGFFYKIIEKRTLELGPGSSELRFYKNLALASDHLAAKVELKTPGLADALDLDNEAFVLVPKFKQARILAITPGNLFLEAALLLNRNFEVDVMTPDDPFLHPGGSEELRVTNLNKTPYDVVIFDNSFWDEDTPPISPAIEVPGNFLYINPKGAASPFQVSNIDEPIIERIDRKHPIARWLVLKDLNLVRGSKIRTQSGDRVVVRSVDGPLVVARREAGSNLVAIGFSIVESDLVFRVALPVMLINTVDWFLDESNSLIQAYRTGQNWHVPVPVGLGAINIKNPHGAIDKNLPTHEGKAVYYGAYTGFYALSPAEEFAGMEGVPEQWEIAANFSSARESDITPASKPIPSHEAVAVGEKPTEEKDPQLEQWSWVFNHTDYDIWLYCVFAVLGLLLLEWFTYHRRWTV